MFWLYFLIDYQEPLSEMLHVIVFFSSDGDRAFLRAALLPAGRDWHLSTQGWCWYMQTQLSQWLIIQCRTLTRCAHGRLPFGSEKKTSQDSLSTLMKKMALPVSAIVNTCCWAAAFGKNFSGCVYQYRLFKRGCSNYIFLALPLINAFSINWSKKYLAKHCFLEYLCLQKINKEIESNLNLWVEL